MLLASCERLWKTVRRMSRMSGIMATYIHLMVSLAVFESVRADVISCRRAVVYAATRPPEPTPFFHAVGGDEDNMCSEKYSSASTGT